MSETLRAYVVVMFLSVGMCWFMGKPALGLFITPADLRRRSIAWLLLVSLAFLAHNFWVLLAGGAAVILQARRQETNPVALFFFLLFAVPPFSQLLPGFGSVTVTFAMNMPRLLALLILLPAALEIRRQNDRLRFGKSWVDWLLVSYLLLQVVLYYQYSSFPYLLRNSVVYAFIEILLPYYVISRSVRTVRQFREVATAFVMAAMLLAPIAVFEMGKHWLLYSTLASSLGVNWGFGNYLARDGTIRAVASLGHAIALGYVMCVALALYASLQPGPANQRKWLLGLGILLAGLVAPLSRGPWVGAAVALVVIVGTGPQALKRASRLLAAGAFVFGLLMLTPYADKIINYLPFVGDVDSANVTYRQRLFEVSMRVISVNPWFGTPDFLANPAMDELVQGEGIVDLVNSYLNVALSSGYVGLGLYVGVFVLSALGVLRALRRVADKGSDLHKIGRACLGAVAGILVILATCSSISMVPWVYWCVIGLCVAYARMVAVARNTAPAVVPGPVGPAAHKHLPMRPRAGLTRHG